MNIIHRSFDAYAKILGIWFEVPRVTFPRKPIAPTGNAVNGICGITLGFVTSYLSLEEKWETVSS